MSNWFEQLGYIVREVWATIMLLIALPIVLVGMGIEYLWCKLLGKPNPYASNF